MINSTKLTLGWVSLLWWITLLGGILLVGIILQTVIISIETWKHIGFWIALQTDGGGAAMVDVEESLLYQ
jgi:hypothetical protein